MNKDWSSLKKLIWLRGRPTTPPPPDYTGYWLKFESRQPFSIETYDHAKRWNGIIEVSPDGEDWAEWSGELRSYSTLYMRGTGNSKITNGDDAGRFVINGISVECTGNIENLLDYKTIYAGEHPAMDSYCYAYLFHGCTALATAPALPATTLARACYSEMFHGCTALATAPALPATTLAQYCYEGMFYGCTALVNVSALPATSLTSACYANMFAGCTALVTPPQILATECAIEAGVLAPTVCQQMFSGCSSLASAPKLYITNIGQSAYGSMFAGTSFRLRSDYKAGFDYSFRAPNTGTGTESYAWNRNMFENDGQSSYITAPDINTTYYANFPSI